VPWNKNEETYVEYSLSSCQGWRIHQEDEFFSQNYVRRLDDESCGDFSSWEFYACHGDPVLGDDRGKILESHAIFGVLDGHGGNYAAKFVKRHFISLFCRQSEFLAYCDLFVNFHSSNRKSKSKQYVAGNKVHGKALLGGKKLSSKKVDNLQEEFFARCTDIISTIFQEGESDLGLITEELSDTCLKKGSRDNMTVFLLKFPSQRVGNGGGVLKRRKRRQATVSK
jgi:serine/threonine protein phosphatase PrpC